MSIICRKRKTEKTNLQDMLFRGSSIIVIKLDVLDQSDLFMSVIMHYASKLGKKN